MKWGIIQKCKKTNRKIIYITQNGITYTKKTNKAHNLAESDVKRT